MKRITVTFEERNYPITTAPGLFNKSASFLPLRSGEQVVLVTNKAPTPLYLDKIRGVPEQTGANVDSVIFPDGEQRESLAILDTVSMALLQKLHGRDTILVALGGGAMGDLVGFTAASYQRGIRFIQTPTTLLSQVNSSAGGKAAVSHPLGKSMIGAFYQPVSAVMDLDCLKTLLPRELASGLTEVIRHGTILDGALFNRLEENLDASLCLDGPAMAYCIRRCYELKVEIAAIDKCETGLRALLNLGYTFGHAIEAEVGYGNWLHGETVAVGMVVAAWMSEHSGQFSSAETQRIITLFTRVRLPVNGPCGMSTQVYLPYVLRDKKVLAGEMRLILPLVIGKNKVRGGVSHEPILSVIANCQSA